MIGVHHEVSFSLNRIHSNVHQCSLYTFGEDVVLCSRTVFVLSNSEPSENKPMYFFGDGRI